MKIKKFNESFKNIRKYGLLSDIIESIKIDDTFAGFGIIIMCTTSKNAILVNKELLENGYDSVIESEAQNALGDEYYDDSEEYTRQINLVLIKW